MGIGFDARKRMDRQSWQGAFVRSLQRLCPDLNPDAVDELSDSEFAQFADVDPASAAADWASRLGPLPDQHTASPRR